MAVAWASALGLAMPGVRPSLLVAVPRITARIGSPSRMASSSRFKTTAFTASALMYPSALTSNVWHFPDGDAAPLVAPSSMLCSGLRYILHPATMASVISPVFRYRQATSTPTKLPEHAVSMVKLEEMHKYDPFDLLDCYELLPWSSDV